MLNYQADNCCTITCGKLQARFDDSRPWLRYFLELLRRPTLIERLELISDSDIMTDIKELLSLLEERKYIVRLNAENESAAAFIQQNKRDAVFDLSCQIEQERGIQLAMPMPVLDDFSLDRSLGSRYSSNRASGVSLTEDHLSRLLMMTYGFYTNSKGCRRRVVPSAGGLSPLTVFASIVDGCRMRSYIYDPQNHSIEFTSTIHASVSMLCNNQETVVEAIAVVVYVYDVKKNANKYGARGLQFALIEAGHASQNLILSASDIGLGTRCIGAVDFEIAGAMYSLLPSQVPIYAVALY